MDFILIIAALYNLVGAYQIWFKASDAKTTTNSIPNDYMQYRIFTGGTAFLFSLIYIYVYCAPDIAVPLLIFGIALKLWSFVSAFICYKKFNFPKIDLIKTGVGNLVFAVLFISYLVTRPTI